MALLSFAGGTTSAPYTFPAGYTSYGTWQYSSVNDDRILSSSAFSQAVDNTVLGADSTTTVVISYGGAGGSEAAICIIDTAKTGCSFIFTGSTVLFRKEVAGFGDATITAATASDMITGDNTVTITRTHSTGAYSLSVNGVPKIAGVYTDTLAGLRSGIQNYNSGNNHAFKSMEVTQGATVSIDTLTTNGVSGVVIGQPFLITSTELDDLATVAIKTASTPAATVNATSLIATNGDGGGIMPLWVDGQYYPFPGTVTVTATDSASASAIGTFTLSLPDTYLSQIFDGAVTWNATYLGALLSAILKPLANGDKAYWPDVNNLRFATNGKISCANSTTSELVIHRTSGLVEIYTINVTDAAEASLSSANSQKRRRQQAVLHTTYYRNRFR